MSSSRSSSLARDVQNIPGASREPYAHPLYPEYPYVPMQPMIIPVMMPYYPPHFAYPNGRHRPRYGYQHDQARDDDFRGEYERGHQHSQVRDYHHRGGYELGHQQAPAHHDRQQLPQDDADRARSAKRARGNCSDIEDVVLCKRYCLRGATGTGRSAEPHGVRAKIQKEGQLSGITGYVQRTRGEEMYIVAEGSRFQHAHFSNFLGLAHAQHAWSSHHIAEEEELIRRKCTHFFVEKDLNYTQLDGQTGRNLVDSGPHSPAQHQRRRPAPRDGQLVASEDEEEEEEEEWVGETAQCR